MATPAKYGSWKSPITSELLTQSSRVFQEIHVDLNTSNTGIVYWLECRYDEGGRFVICSQKTGGTPQSLTPKDYSARTRVCEKDDGAFFVNDGKVYFSNSKDQRIYVQTSPDSIPSPITPDQPYRFANGELNNKTGLIYSIREDFICVERKEAKHPVHTIVVINPKTREQNVLVEGCDFYSHPRVSPDGKKIAWIQWHHPNMPFDTTELWMAKLTESGGRIMENSATMVAGGNDESVLQPGWTSDNELLYVSDKSDWWNLYHVTSSGKHVNLLQREAEMTYSRPTYAVDLSGNGRIALIIGGELGILNMKNGQYDKLDTGFTVHKFVNITVAGELYCCGASPTHLPCLLKINCNTKEVEILRLSKHLSVDKGYLSTPEKISWNTTFNDISYGFYYPPQNKDFQGLEDTKPPLLVKAHSGPVFQASNVLDLKIQYFTSRGFAVLDVDYRGSTGYGKKYRRKIRGRWGIYDRDDCCSGAQHLVDSGKVDPDKLCMDGCSSGGYATLTCLTSSDTFKAGASSYGIGDLEALLQDTIKYEYGYLDTLICPYSCGGIQIYKDRSPINFVDQLKCPVAFFHGENDKVVLPNQTQMMYQCIKEKGLSTMFILFKGEQHGFKKSENIMASLDGEFYFFSTVFDFEPADNDFGFQLKRCDCMVQCSNIAL